MCTTNCTGKVEIFQIFPPCIDCNKSYVNVINFFEKKITEIFGENVQPVFSNLSIPGVYGLETSKRCSPSDFSNFKKRMTV